MTNKKMRHRRGREIRKATGLPFVVAMKAARFLGKKFPLEMMALLGDSAIIETYHCCDDCGIVMSVQGFVGPKGEWRPS